MALKALASKLNIKKQCRNLGVPLWSCPQFIFLIMGVVIIAVILVTYTVGQRFINAEIIAVIVLFVTIFLFIISFIIIRAFEKVVESKKLEAEQAQEILRLKDQFVFIATHELRTPANAIKWGLDELRREHPELAEKGDELLDIIQRGNDRLLALVNDLLEVARIESKMIEISLEKVNADTVLQDACNELADLADSKKITINCNNDPQAPPVLANSARLKEIFLNLISNAIKYGKIGSTVRVEQSVRNDIIVFSIHNTGVGLTKEEQEHVFEKFWRSRKSQNTEGTGLGLFITKQLIELMSGTIWFSTKEDGNTTFSFSLKRADVSVH